MAQITPGEWVQPAGWLVKNEDARAVEEGFGEDNALGLTA
jgi:hypothetical protein